MNSDLMPEPSMDHFPLAKACFLEYLPSGLEIVDITVQNYDPPDLSDSDDSSEYCAYHPSLWRVDYKTQRCLLVPPLSYEVSDFIGRASSFFKTYCPLGAKVVKAFPSQRDINNMAVWTVLYEATYYHLPKREMKHTHKCGSCGIYYTHIHAYAEHPHPSYDFSCPSPTCVEYHRGNDCYSAVPLRGIDFLKFTPYTFQQCISVGAPFRPSELKPLGRPFSSS